DSWRRCKQPSPAPAHPSRRTCLTSGAATRSKLSWRPYETRSTLDFAARGRAPLSILRPHRKHIREGTGRAASLASHEARYDAVHRRLPPNDDSAGGSRGLMSPATLREALGQHRWYRRLSGEGVLAVLMR